jgi:hypothetical protein
MTKIGLQQLKYIRSVAGRRVVGEIIHIMLNLRNEKNNSLLEDFLVAWYVNTEGVVTSVGN